MVTLEDIQQEFPNANYAPNPECKYCGGTGFEGPRKVIVARADQSGDIHVVTEERPNEGHQPCVCIFVGGGSQMQEFVRESLSKLATEELSKLRQE